MFFFPDPTFVFSMSLEQWLLKVVWQLPARSRLAEKRHGSPKRLAVEHTVVFFAMPEPTRLVCMDVSKPVELKVGVGGDGWENNKHILYYI